MHIQTNENMDAKKCHSDGVISSVHIKVVLLVKIKILRNLFKILTKVHQVFSGGCTSTGFQKLYAKEI